MRPAACLLVLLAALAGAARAAETRITGGRMELLNKGADVIFKGNVRLERGGDLLLADEMRTTRERDKVTAIGNVRLTRTLSSTETVKAFGTRGHYNTQTGAGHLVGNRKQAHVVRYEEVSSTATRVTHLYANRIDFFRDEERALARGRASGSAEDPATGDRYEFTAPSAEYLGERRRVVLKTEAGEDLPVLVQLSEGERRVVSGETVIYDIDEQHLVTQGRAKAVLRGTGKGTRE